MNFLRGIAASAAMVLAFASLTAPLSAAIVPGRTAGQFQVAESGAATYTIPIASVPGSAGIEPQLALAYGSQGGNSLVGIGWSLAGLSTISRCPSTRAQDGALDPVDFDASDRFCLDGERLMAIDGVYGADGTEYRTEQDTFRQIHSIGQAGSGPSSFRVRTKSGLIFEYGGTEDSRIEAAGKPSVLFWAVSRISDTRGNYLTVSYFEDGAEYRPSRVDYTANVNTGFSLYASIRFEYESRPDARPAFVSGSLLKTTQRLKAVRSYEEEQLYREYLLAYETSAATGNSRLASVTECGSDGSCFAPTAFGWQSWAATDFNFNRAGSGSWPGHAGAVNNNFVGDFDGDGKSDTLAYVSGSQWHVALSTGTAFGGVTGFWSGHSGGAGNNLLGDYNGDGKTDIMAYTSGGIWRVALSTGAGFNAPGSGNWAGHGHGLGNNFLGDFDGDGRTDIVGFTGTLGSWQVGLSSGDNFNAPGTGIWSGHRGRPADNFVGDFNGDGRSDLMGYTGTPGSWHVTLSNGATAFDAPGSGIWSGHGGVSSNNFLGDFNGDGKTDIMGYSFGVGGLWHVALSDGTNFNAPGSGNWQGHGGGPSNNILGDFNGDGMTDIAGFKNSGSLWSVCLSTGTNFSCRDWVGHPGGIANNFLGDFDGDGKTDLMRRESNGVWQVALAGGLFPDLLTTVAEAHGVTTQVVYAPLTSGAVYSRGSGAVYPEVDFQAPAQVVASYSRDNGVGGRYPYSYRYSGARVDLAGRGFRGFASMEVKDDHTGISTVLYYDRSFQSISTKIRRSEQRQPSGALISEVDNEIVVQDHGFGVSFSYIEESVAKNYEIDGSLVSEVETFTDVDDYGNVRKLRLDYGDGFTETTVNAYEDDLERWLLGRLTGSQVTKTAPGHLTQTRASAFTYDPVSGLLLSETIEPASPTLRLTKTYQYDIFGNVVTSTTEGPGFTSRSHGTLYTYRGRFVRQSTNALGHTESRTHDLGNLTSVTGPNLLVTTFEYDGFGRQTRELRADGTETRTEYLSCAGDCPPRAVYYVRTVETGEAPRIAYFDMLDRVVRQESAGFDGTPIYADTQYNARGLAKWLSEPYFAGEEPLWTERRFDLLGRIYWENAPGDRLTTTTFAGRTTTVTNPLGQVGVRVTDPRGQLIASTDNLQNTLAYDYDVFGNLVRLEDPAGNLTTFAYDLRGNRISIDDPDTGVTTFVYNALGELVSQTSAGGQIVTFGYDLLGRMIRRSEAEGTSTWTYDTQTQGIGKLSRVSRGDYAEDYFYDALGRLERTRTTIAGSSFDLQTSYDLLGRPEILTYPGGYAVRTLYNPQGFPQELRRTSDNHPLWVAGELNARGQLESATLGNGLATTREFDAETGRIRRIRTGSVQDLDFAFDAIGNLESRGDRLRGLAETFRYDDLNRLTSSQVAGRPEVAIGYDDLGNITSKSDAGVYTYGENGAGPHAVTSIVGPRSATYAYDANGNLVRRQRTAPAGLIFADGFESGNTAAWNTAGSPPQPVVATIAYTSFHKPRTITEGAVQIAFSYGPDHARYRQVVTTAGGATTKLYVGGLFEREIRGAIVRDIHYLQAGGETFAVYTRETGGPATIASTRYLHRDHLGSLQTVTAESGALVETLAYDPWGLRRNANDWSAAAAPIVPGIDRGFTGHEHLDEVGLIHMNGRVYDPAIGRFLSADPFVQAPDYTQGLNRYSYVLNNPLSLTDPSGYFFKGLFRAIKRVVRSVFNFISNNFYSIIQLAAASTGNFWAIVGTNFAISVATGIQSGAGFGDIFLGALTSAAISAVTTSMNGALSEVFESVTFGSPEHLQSIIAHGVVGGASSALRGGKFEHGFVSSAFRQSFAPAFGGNGDEDTKLNIHRVVAASVVGGTAETMGGGKFANGAVTGAFTHGGLSIWDVPGKLWSSPNTAIGLLYGGVSYLAGQVGHALGWQTMRPEITFGNNAIQFSNSPLMSTAMTLGNAIVYGTSDNVQPGQLGPVEFPHTIQSEVLGPFYFPAHVALGIPAFLINGDWHGPINLLEQGPHRFYPPRPWP